MDGEGVRMGRIVVADGQVQRQARCQVLCLDKDGLLFDSATFWQALWHQRECAIGHVLPAEGLSRLKPLLGVDSTGEIDGNGPLALAFPRDEVAIAAAVLYATTGTSWDAALRLMEQAFTSADASLNLHAALKPLPGFPEIIYRAKRAGIKVAIVTSDDEQRTKNSMELFAVYSMIDFICTPANVNRGKPYPDMLLHVAAHFGVHVNDLVMVGDSLVDVEMANNAGAVGIAVPPSERIRDFHAELVVPSLDDIHISSF